jgi:hypothetical protein
MIDNMIRTNLFDEIFETSDQEEGDGTIFSEILGPSKPIIEISSTELAEDKIGQRKLLKIIEEK